MRSSSIGGFYLMNHGSDFKPHFSKLVKMVDNDELKVLMDFS